MTARIGLADAQDPRILEAAARLAATSEVVPVLIGADPADLPNGVECIAPPPGADAVDHLAELVASSDLHAGVSGSLTASAEVIRAGIRRLGSGGLVSGCFAIQHASDWKTYADCVVVPEPDAGQLADIAVTAAEHHRRTFHTQPRVAMLSFSTAGSARHPRVAMVQEAVRLIAARRPELAVHGEVQFDVAIDPEVAARKAADSSVAGRANVLVFPSLEAGNIAYKVAERVGGARALGSFVLGLATPWVDLSRGCSIDDVVDTVLLLARQHTTHGPLARQPAAP